MIIEDENFLQHYGILRRSGRYPWGSGGPENASNQGFLDYVTSLEKQGLSQVEIAKGMNTTTTQIRAAKSLVKNEIKQQKIHQAERLKDKGMSLSAIGREMGINESSVRSLLAPGVREKSKIIDSTSSMLKDQVAKKMFVDVGKGAEYFLGVSRNKLDLALAKLKEEGYKVEQVKHPQVGTGKLTTYKVLVPPGTPYAETYKNRFNIQPVSPHSVDGGQTFTDPNIKPPQSISSKRVAVRYREDGGDKEDGIIYIRPGVDDVSMGKSRYAQVRIAVDDSHYIKGVAIYKDDLPKGVDIVVNSPKSKAETPTKLDALKPMKEDKTTGKIDYDNPFESVISRQHGVMNILREEGDWGTWSKSLSSQILSKQPPKLAQQQLNMTLEQKKNELGEIRALTNPAVRRELLRSFSDDADASAVHLQAAYLPRQASYVIIPVPTLKDNEVFAPNFRPGERVVLIRHPHGGIFEIPELTVNNRHRDAKKLLGDSPPDAIGINANVALKLSGADFDGDAVLVIPNNSDQIRTGPMLARLKNFDAKFEYREREGMKYMTKHSTQVEMGKISNLITDMTIQKASLDEISRAVRHSMVVIDAEKHKLDYRQSETDHGIKALKEKYQGGKKAGAATLISRAGSEIRVPDRGYNFSIDPVSGQKIYKYTGNTFPPDSKGRVRPVTVSSSRMAETDDARTLLSKGGLGTPIERVYADHANKLKAMANQARLDMVRTKSIPYSPSAKAAYSEEVRALNARLNIALRNAPLERQAQVIANAMIDAKKKANPGMDRDELKKIKRQSLAVARTRTGAGKQRIQIEPSEWDAIQAGAISNHKLEQILANANLEQIKQLATPRTRRTMSTTKLSRARSMLASGYSMADVADHLGVSVTTLQGSLNGD